MEINSLSGEQRRQMVDTQQVFEAFREATIEHRRRFLGNMRWGERQGRRYLLRKTGKSETSLGPMSEETQAAYEAFTQGRGENEARRKNLSGRLNALARVNKAMGLGRVPSIAARILRRCDEVELVGTQIVVVGTNALFAYEAKAGVHFSSDILATQDIDFLFDARRRLSLAAAEVREQCLLGVLRKADRTFRLTNPRSFRAVNDDGYLVDLIRPEPRDPITDRRSRALTDVEEDFEGAPIIGLNWLINTPKLVATAIDTNGLPVRLVVADPRAFALHKAWLSKHGDRDPLKKTRDLAQAKAAAIVAEDHLGLSFADTALTGIPATLRADMAELLAERPASDIMNTDW